MENMKTVNHTLYIYKDGFLTADMLAASPFNVPHPQYISIKKNQKIVNQTAHNNFA